LSLGDTALILFILGIVQGIAEFLPVSSSGHLAIMESLPWFSGLFKALGPSFSLLVNVMFHIATLIAVLIFLRKDIISLVKGAASGMARADYRGPELRSIAYILLATLPAGILGLLLHKTIESFFSSPRAVCVLLIINGFILLSSKIIPQNSRKIEEMGMMRSLIVGLFQAVAILPGISRSGMTIMGGLISGLVPVEAAKFSFLMAIPVIAGAGLIESVKVFGSGFPEGIILPLSFAMIVTVIVALFSIKILMEFVRRIRIDVFGYYTILLGAAGLFAIHSLAR
jgi:undecaprenyl-diphosphatase